jgi:hypothetical protein
VEPQDRCDPGARLSVLFVTSSEPDDAPGPGDGATIGDIQITVAPPPSGPVILLRAERDRRGPGRVYTLRGEARDISGNTTAAAATVTVPRQSRSKGPR